MDTILYRQHDTAPDGSVTLSGLPEGAVVEAVRAGFVALATGETPAWSPVTLTADAADLTGTVYVLDVTDTMTSAAPGVYRGALVVEYHVVTGGVAGDSQRLSDPVPLRLVVKPGFAAP